MVATAQETVSDGSKSAKYAANNTLSAQNNSVVTTAKKHSLQKVLAKAQAHFPKFLVVSLTKKKGLKI